MTNYIKLGGKWVRAAWRTLDRVTQYALQERHTVDANGYQYDRLAVRIRGRGKRPDSIINSLVG